jgi:hypothetical protein
MFEGSVGNMGNGLLRSGIRSHGPLRLLPRRTMIAVLLGAVTACKECLAKLLLEEGTGLVKQHFRKQVAS